ncbi:conserved hypothetical protein [Tenacibaculum sp. 190524A05c]|uniref:hypothetical protein n=1 Tax=Tenacibaculum platacis TaxID=3137852 RepID=UPI0031FA5E83
MKKLLPLFLTLMYFYSCSEKKEDSWKEKLSSLKEELAEKDSIIKAYKLKELNLSKVKSKVEKRDKPNNNIYSLGIVDKQVLIDTIELNPLVVFEREVELVKLQAGLSIEDLGSISEFREELGYKVFSICNGEALPIEMCNCTHNIYVAIEPEELGKPFELLKLGLFYNVELKFLGQKEREGDMLLTFEQGEFKRKVLQVNLTTMKFL